MARAGMKVKMMDCPLTVLKERDKVGLGSLLESHDGGGLESEVGLEVLGDFSDESLEGELSDEELSRPGGGVSASYKGLKPVGLTSGIA